MTWAWVKDTLERLVRTFLQGWFGAWLIETDKSWRSLGGKSLFVGFVAAAASLVMCLAALERGDPRTASLVE